ncbi:hypothetical protein GQ44DRAFT_607365 [Phaeosphaeriaceae sp. PMI808]|nr:hypothetical protein GQ44DRAFT_607365 [Phaeosphaeriaceae sp. PMI808]
MASFGKVLDLFDDRYLNLQDVVGNVEPLPTLVPYSDYTQNVFVYRMDTSHNLFLALIHEFTDRMSQEKSKELWTWYVQWEVSSEEPSRLCAPTPSPKKPRLGNEQFSVKPHEPQKEPPASVIDIFDRCVLNSQLKKDEEMLRILIDIVQAESTIVPNFIEFLYRWIDYFEGDGTALKAALQWEIPSLWDFEYHPLVLPAELKQKVKDVNAEQGKAAENYRAQQLVQGSPTKKMRKKPDLSAMERQTEESERLQYREVKYGIQPPNIIKHLPPLINIPQDERKRIKYYAACFRSRQRALVLLLEAGVSIQQIGNYKKMQKEHPGDTSDDGDSKEMKSLQHYRRDADYAQNLFMIREKLQDKQKEIAISRKLAIEAQLAAKGGIPEGSSGVPLIPPTPSHIRCSNMSERMLNRIQAPSAKGPKKINFVPSLFVGMMKSKLFEDAKGIRAAKEKMLLRRGRFHDTPPRTVWDEILAMGDEGSDEGSHNGSDNGNTHARLDDDYSMGDNSNRSATFTANTPAQPGLSASPSTITTIVPQASQTGSASLPSLPPSIRPPTVAITSGQSQPSLTPSPFSARSPISTTLPASGSRIQYVDQRPMGSQVHQSSSGPMSVQSPSQIGVSFNQNIQQLPDYRSVSLLPPQVSRPQQMIRPVLSMPQLHRLTPLPHASSSTEISNVLTQPQASNPANSTLPPRTQDQSPGLQPQTAPQQFSRPATQPSLPHPIPPYITITAPQLQQPQSRPSPSSTPTISPPRTGIQRNAPTPLTLTPPSPSLVPSILNTCPFAPKPQGTPLQIYFPKIVVPSNDIGFGGARLGNAFDNALAVETDAILLGYTQPGSGKITLTRALFMPMGMWQNTLRQVQKGAYQALETYMPGAEHVAAGTNRLVGKGRAHSAAYAKLAEVYGIMRGSVRREEEVTKRWRASKGVMTRRDRGAVWEGWGVTLDKAIEMSVGEREGAKMSSWLVDEGVDKRTAVEEDERANRMRELEALMEEEEEQGLYD